MANCHYQSAPMRALTETFKSVESAIESASQQTGSDELIRMSGTTATVCLRLGSKLYIAHVGDSRALFCSFAAPTPASRSTLSTQGSETGDEEAESLSAVETTRDHNPSRPDERARIERCGGEVRRSMDNLPFRVCAKNKHKPGLAMSRAIGDTEAQKYGVVHEPELKVVDVTDSGEIVHNYLVIASDGVWEVMGNEEIAKEIRTHHVAGERTIAEKIAQKAATKWLQLDRYMSDDITVIVHCIRSNGTR